MEHSSQQGKLLAGRYRVLGRLGAGGMAVVVLAEDERLGRKVAVKRLRAPEAGMDDAVRRFQREARLGASLNHPNIVAVYDVVRSEEDVLIVMEYVDGHTLRLEMDSGPMSPARVIEVLHGVANGLDHAHQNGVVHRDVKPANVLISARDGAVKITDLGIATAAERTNITNSGQVLGTASYMAPERLEGQAGGPAVDVYAVAALAFEMLSGRKAITGSTPMEIARRVTSAPRPDLAEVVPDAPAGVADVLKRGMAKDPDERPGSSGELVRDLAAAYADAATEPAPAAVPPAAVPPAAALPVTEPRAAAEPPRGEESPRAAAPIRTGSSARRRSGWMLPALLALVVAAVVLAVVLGSGSDEPQPGKAAKHRQQAANPKTSSSAGTTPAPAPSPSTSAPATTPSAPATPTPAPSAGKDPVKTVTGFYTRAAKNDFAGAWALGTGNLHAQFPGGLHTFKATLATLESIEFPTVKATDPNTVEFTSIAHHTDRTDKCSGTATLVKGLIDHLSVQCAPR